MAPGFFVLPGDAEGKPRLHTQPLLESSTLPYKWLNEECHAAD